MPGNCARCSRPVYFAEERLAAGKVWHTFCFSCRDCKRLLDQISYETDGQELYCRSCLRSRNDGTDFDDGPCHWNKSACEARGCRARFSPSTSTRSTEDCWERGEQMLSISEESTPHGDQLVMFPSRPLPTPNAVADWYGQKKSEQQSSGMVYPKPRMMSDPNNSIYTQSNATSTNTVFSQQYLNNCRRAVPCNPPPCNSLPCNPPPCNPPPCKPPPCNPPPCKCCPKKKIRNRLCSLNDSLCCRCQKGLKPELDRPCPKPRCGSPRCQSPTPRCPTPCCPSRDRTSTKCGSVQLCTAPTPPCWKPRCKQRPRHSPRPFKEAVCFVTDCDVLKCESAQSSAMKPPSCRKPPCRCCPGKPRCEPPASSHERPIPRCHSPRPSDERPPSNCDSVQSSNVSDQDPPWWGKSACRCCPGKSRSKRQSQCCSPGDCPFLQRALRSPSGQNLQRRDAHASRQRQRNYCDCPKPQTDDGFKICTNKQEKGYSEQRCEPCWDRSPECVQSPSKTGPPRCLALCNKCCNRCQDRKTWKSVALCRRCYLCTTLK